MLGLLDDVVHHRHQVVQVLGTLVNQLLLEQVVQKHEGSRGLVLLDQVVFNLLDLRYAFLVVDVLEKVAGGAVGTAFRDEVEYLQTQLQENLVLIVDDIVAGSDVIRGERAVGLEISPEQEYDGVDHPVFVG